MNKKTLRMILLGFWAMSGVTQVSAGSDGALTVTVENDFFTNSDNNYTKGIAIARVSSAVDAKVSSSAELQVAWICQLVGKRLIRACVQA